MIWRPARRRVHAAIRRARWHPGDRAERRVIGAYDQLVRTEECS